MGQSRLAGNGEERIDSSSPVFPGPFRFFSPPVHSKAFKTSLVQNIA